VTTRRTTNLSVQVEEKPPANRRITNLAVMVETHPPLPRRFTSLAVMVECTPSPVVGRSFAVVIG
jgi:hypothetical protein